MPRKAHRVSEMLEPMPCSRVRLLGFQASENVARLNHSQPMTESSPTGMMTPQTVIAPMRPVRLGPPKFATVVSQSRAITPMQVIIGVEESAGKSGKIAECQDGDRHVAHCREGNRGKTPGNDRNSVSVFGIGRHASGSGIENTRLGKAIGDGHRAKHHHQP